MYHESTQHEQNCFVTLTYEDNPGVINKRDLQLFFKRLRHLVPVRYFACGEYGSKTHRPHYHAVIFGADFRGNAIAINDSLWSSPYLSSAWSKGMVSVGDVSIASCMYVAGYVNKKIGDPDTFTIMSRRPGIGHGWLDRYREELSRTGVVAIDGKEYPIPSRYLSWYESDFEQLKRERQAYFRNLTPAQICKRREVLAAREANYKSKNDQRIEAL